MIQMAKIVLVTGEHTEEIMAVTRARQVKPLLERKGHDVQVIPYHNPVAMQRFVQALERAKDEKQAFAQIEEFREKIQANQYNSFAIAKRLALEHPGAHLFSFHSIKSKKSSSKPRSMLTRYLLDDSLLRPALAPSLEDYRTQTNLDRSPSIVFYNFLGRGPESRAVGVVEMPAHYVPYHSKADQRIRKAGEYLDAWKATKPAGDQAAKLFSAWLFDQILHRTTQYARGTGPPELMKEEHAQAIADRIHKLVKRAERMAPRLKQGP